MALVPPPRIALRATSACAWPETPLRPAAAALSSRSHSRPSTAFVRIRRSVAYRRSAACAIRGASADGTRPKLKNPKLARAFEDFLRIREDRTFGTGVEARASCGDRNARLC
eukprot:6175857-Pleurochrysis_carterae.AAC.1